MSRITSIFDSHSTPNLLSSRPRHAHSQSQPQTISFPTLNNGPNNTLNNTVNNTPNQSLNNTVNQSLNGGGNREEAMKIRHVSSLSNLASSCCVPPLSPSENQDPDVEVLGSSHGHTHGRGVGEGTSTTRRGSARESMLFDGFGGRRNGSDQGRAREMESLSADEADPSITWSRNQFSHSNSNSQQYQRASFSHGHNRNQSRNVRESVTSLSSITTNTNTNANTEPKSRAFSSAALRGIREGFRDRTSAAYSNSQSHRKREGSISTSITSGWTVGWEDTFSMTSTVTGNVTVSQGQVQGQPIEKDLPSLPRSSTEETGVKEKGKREWFFNSRPPYEGFFFNQPPAKASSSSLSNSNTNSTPNSRSIPKHNQDASRHKQSNSASAALGGGFVPGTTLGSSSNSSLGAGLGETLGIPNELLVNDVRSFGGMERVVEEEGQSPALPPKNNSTMPNFQPRRLSSLPLPPPQRSLSATAPLFIKPRNRNGSLSSGSGSNANTPANNSPAPSSGGLTPKSQSMSTSSSGNGRPGSGRSIRGPRPPPIVIPKRRNNGIAYGDTNPSASSSSQQANPATEGSSNRHLGAGLAPISENRKSGASQTLTIGPSTSQSERRSSHVSTDETPSSGYSNPAEVKVGVAKRETVNRRESEDGRAESHTTAVAAMVHSQEMERREERGEERKSTFPTDVSLKSNDGHNDRMLSPSIDGVVRGKGEKRSSMASQASRLSNASFDMRNVPVIFGTSLAKGEEVTMFTTDEESASDGGGDRSSSAASTAIPLSSKTVGMGLLGIERRGASPGRASSRSSQAMETLMDEVGGAHELSNAASSAPISNAASSAGSQSNPPTLPSLPLISPSLQISGSFSPSFNIADINFDSPSDSNASNTPWSATSNSASASAPQAFKSFRNYSETSVSTGKKEVSLGINTPSTGISGIGSPAFSFSSPSADGSTENLLSNIGHAPAKVSRGRMVYNSRTLQQGQGPRMLEERMRTGSLPQIKEVYKESEMLAPKMRPRAMSDSPSPSPSPRKTEFDIRPQPASTMMTPATTLNIPKPQRMSRSPSLRSAVSVMSSNSSLSPSPSVAASPSLMSQRNPRASPVPTPDATQQTKEEPLKRSATQQTASSIGNQDVGLEAIPFEWNTLSVTEARKQLDPRELQDIIVAAIREYNDSPNSLLMGKMEDVVADLEKYKGVKADLEAKYGKEITRRGTVLSRHVLSLRAFNGEEGGRFAEGLVRAVNKSDQLSQRIAQVSDHINKTEKLRDEHWRAAASLSLAKLNASYLKTKDRVKASQVQVRTLEEALKKSDEQKKEALERVKELEEHIRILQEANSMLLSQAMENPTSTNSRFSKSSSSAHEYQSNAGNVPSIRGPGSIDSYYFHESEMMPSRQSWATATEPNTPYTSTTHDFRLSQFPVPPPELPTREVDVPIITTDSRGLLTPTSIKSPRRRRRKRSSVRPESSIPEHGETDDERDPITSSNSASPVPKQGPFRSVNTMPFPDDRPDSEPDLIITIDTIGQDHSANRPQKLTESPGPTTRDLHSASFIDTRKGSLDEELEELKASSSPLSPLSPDENGEGKMTTSRRLASAIRQRIGSLRRSNSGSSTSSPRRRSISLPSIIAGVTAQEPPLSPPQDDSKYDPFAPPPMRPLKLSTAKQILESLAEEETDGEGVDPIRVNLSSIALSYLDSTEIARALVELRDLR